MERSNIERDRDVAALFDRHYVPMCRLAYVILGNSALAEEIVMDALLKTFSSWWRLRDPSKADLYLRRAVINLCRSRIRRKQLESKHQERMRSEGASGWTQWEGDRLETDQVVLDAVRDLPERQRACVVLRYYEDMSEAEIARVLDCSTGTVKSQLSKARSKLEAALGPALQGGER